MPRTSEIAGLLIVDKPVGVTSHDVVRAVRRIAATRQVGHAGTLDPDATGVLPIAVGSATRLLRYLETDRKSYDFEVQFGEATETDDASGAIVREAIAAHVDEAAILEVLERFVGAIDQVPPRFSAIRIDGVRAHERARRGESFAMPARPVRVDALRVRWAEPPRFGMQVECGSGVYVRSIARDLGEALKSAAHARAIRRTSVGSWDLKDAAPLAAIEERGLARSPAFHEPRAMLRGRPELAIDEREIAEIVRGRTIERPAPIEPGPVALTAPSGELVAVALAAPASGRAIALRPKTVLMKPDSE